VARQAGAHRRAFHARRGPRYPGPLVRLGQTFVIENRTGAGGL